jgi:hypothetical protein
MEGYNEVSAFGTGPAETIKDRIDNYEKNYTTTQLEGFLKNPNHTYSKLNESLGKISSPKVTGPNIDEEEGRPEDPGGPSGLDTITGPNIDEDPDPVGDDPGGDDADPSGEDNRDAFGGVPGVPDAISGTIDQLLGAGSLGGGGDPDPSGPTDSGVAPGTGAEGPAGGATMSGPSDNFADDFDDGTMTGVAATTTGGDPVGGFFDAVDKGAGGGGPPSSGFSAPSQQGQSPRGSTTGGGGNSNGGGKIVCTMMNNSYGFGSFRNKIWLRHSKDLAPEYQKGYHKIFLPLVRLSKTNKLLKKILEHIAIHRTIDIRQESRGKVHLLGRVYRKIFEPICYIVGKYGK